MFLSQSYYKFSLKISYSVNVLITVELTIIAFVWSQHDGGNAEQRTMAKVLSKTL